MNMEALRRKAGRYLSAEERSEIEAAFDYSKSAHSGQTRASGKPYIQHPLAVADILADWRFDGESITAALLHDVVEDTPISLRQVRDKFGSPVAELVDGLSKIDRIEGIDRRVQEAETFRKILLAAAKDWRVLFVKLADRLHNMRTLSALDASRRRRIAHETLTIYAPIAERLGFSQVCDELQNLSFRYLRPNRYRVLSKALGNSKAGSSHIVRRSEEMIMSALERRSIKADLEHRRKNLYSIYRKMEKQRLSFASVEDIIGFRLIVEDRMACYAALGALHEKFIPAPGRFKDYIALPKSNGYQSLHTSLVTKGGVKLEIQIRTRGMHEVAEHGLAAHWIYKQQDTSLSAAQTEALQRLSSLVRLHAENDEPGDFMEYLRVELMPSEMYVLTPDGEAVRLPPDSTALDFAYAIHTDVGDHAESAVINGQVMPLSRRLSSGDQVSIKTHPDGRPLPHWLGVAKTARARSRIRHALNAASRADSIALGRSLLAAALHKISGAPAPDKIPKEDWSAFLKARNLKSSDDLYLELGLGRMLPDIAAIGLLRRRIPREKRDGGHPVSIAGAGSAAVSLSSCCYPIPFEPIVGLLQKSRGLTVHACNCPTVLGSRSRKWISTVWSEKADSNMHHSEILLQCANRPGIGTAVSSVISRAGINIVNFNFTGGGIEQDSIAVEAVVEVQSLKRLNFLLASLRKLPEVMEASRRHEAQKA